MGTNHDLSEAKNAFRSRRVKKTTQLQTDPAPQWKTRNVTPVKYAQTNCTRPSSRARKVAAKAAAERQKDGERKGETAGPVGQAWRTATEARGGRGAGEEGKGCVCGGMGEGRLAEGMDGSEPHSPTFRH